jgi:hypothetical protein
VRPGSSLPVGLTVNGVSAQTLCPAASVTLQQSGQPGVAFEPASVSTTNGTCAFVYSAQMTPTLVSAAAAGAVNGTAVNFATSPPTLSLYGNFFVSAADPAAASKVAVTVGGAACTGVAVAAASGTTLITCSLPALPAGVYDVDAVVTGLGSTRPPTTARRGLPQVTYT